MKTTGTILFLLLGVVIFAVVIKYLWSYFVVRLFPGSVEQNLIAKEISWKDSIILGIIFIIISQSWNPYILLHEQTLFIITQQ